MAVAPVSDQCTRKLRALDLDLPSLASEAAIDIDNLLSGSSQDLTAIHSLADRLKNSVESPDLAAPPRSLMDPATLTVLGEAVYEIAPGHPLRTIDDLLAEVVKITRSLSVEEIDEHRAELEQARGFCVALSRTVMAYHKSISDLRPTHPYRK